jgi:hypothetical protein
MWRKLRQLIRLPQQLEAAFAAVEAALAAQADSFGERQRALFAAVEAALAAQADSFGERQKALFAAVEAALADQADSFGERQKALFAAVETALADQADSFGERQKALFAAVETALADQADSLSERQKALFAAVEAALADQADRFGERQKAIEVQLESVRGSAEAQLHRLLDLRQQINDELTVTRMALGHDGEFAAIKRALAEQDSRFTDYVEEFDAQLACLRDPGDLPAAMRFIRLRMRLGKDLPDDIHENALRLQLRIAPYDLALTLSLTALLYRLNRPPMPDPPAARTSGKTSDDGEIDALISAADAHARNGDLLQVFAHFWQACVRYPGSPRGWAEYARCFADRHEWENCCYAARRALSMRAAPDAASADALLVALSKLAEGGRIGDLKWRPWFERLPKPLRINPHAVRLFTAIGSTRAGVLVRPLLQQQPEKAATWLVASMVAFEQDRRSDSYQYLRRAFELDVAGTLAAVVRDWSAPVSLVLREANRADELADWLAERHEQHLELNLIPQSPAPEAMLQARRQRREALEHQLPPSLFIPLYKTASVTVHNILASGFRLPHIIYSLIDRRVVAPWLQEYMRGGAAQATHLYPTPQNIDLLLAGNVKSVIVHVRDPRQVLVSSVQHAVLYPREVEPSARRKVKRDMHKMTDQLIQDIFPHPVAWIEGWVKARALLTVHFTTFEEFVRDQPTFVDRLLALYGGDLRYFNRDAALRQSPAIDYHRRRGETDEWRRIFDARQIEYVNSQIPDHFWTLFGWSP